MDVRIVVLKMAFNVFFHFLLLGLSSFGGPMAHIGFFRERFVQQQAWFSEAMFAQWVVLCNLLPGPSSSQLGFLIGYQRAGWLGALAAFIGFTLPSALIMLVLAYGVMQWQTAIEAWLPALMVLAAAVVIQATWGMAKQFCRHTTTLAMTVISAIALVLLPSPLIAISLLVLNGLIGWRVFQSSAAASPSDEALFNQQPSRAQARLLIALALGLLVVLPLVALFGGIWSLIDSLYRAGALVWGGGHVVLPYLQLEFVQNQQMDNALFLSGYAMAQALPGPMFSFAAYLGALDQGLLGALVAIIAIFLAGLLLVIGILPFYQQLQSYPSIKAAMMGLQATVVGLMLAALINPILPHALTQISLAALLLLNLIWLIQLQRNALLLIPINLAFIAILT